MKRYEIVIDNLVDSYTSKLLLNYWQFDSGEFIDLDSFLKGNDKSHLDLILVNWDSYAIIPIDKCNFCNLPFTIKVNSREMFIKEVNKESKKCNDCVLNSDFFEDGIIVFKELDSDLFTDEEIRLLNKIKRQKTKKIIYDIAFDDKTDTDNMFFFKKKVKLKHWAD